MNLPLHRFVVRGLRREMTAVTVAFWAAVGGVATLWAVAALPILWRNQDPAALWSALMNGTGIVGMAAMSVAMLLAARPVSFESLLGGLDKMYRLHKWLGVTAALCTVAHVVSSQIPRVTLPLGVILRPLHESDVVHAARTIGIAAFFAFATLFAIALAKHVPYRLFAKSHQLLSLVYLALVFHAGVLMQREYWQRPVGVVMALLMLFGIGSVVAILLAKTRRPLKGAIDRIIRHERVRSMEVSVALKGRWAGHEAGQFAFVRFDRREGAHPFTIASSWPNDGKLQFIVKDLGDYTSLLHQSLHIGDSAEVDGPYGRFTFNGSSARQIWISGGIGITPFVARMQHLATKPDGRTIDHFHSAALLDARSVELLQKRARAARVCLHVILSRRAGRLSADRVIETVTDWKTADVWFCGPAAFGRVLRTELLARGLPCGRFHQEIFSLR